jgi:hypothetical protein
LQDAQWNEVHDEAGSCVAPDVGFTTLAGWRAVTAQITEVDLRRSDTWNGGDWVGMKHSKIAFLLLSPCTPMSDQTEKVGMRKHWTCPTPKHLMISKWTLDSEDLQYNNFQKRPSKNTLLFIIQLQKYGYLKSLNGEGFSCTFSPYWNKPMKQLQEPLIANHA